MKTCSICGKQVEDRGLGGHMFAKHGIRTGAAVQVEQIRNKVAQLESETTRLVSTAVRVSEFQRKLSELEQKVRSDLQQQGQSLHRATELLSTRMSAVEGRLRVLATEAERTSKAEVKPVVGHLGEVIHASSGGHLEPPRSHRDLMHGKERGHLTD